MNLQPITYRHCHLNVSGVDTHRGFWVKTLGGNARGLHSHAHEVISFPDGLIFLRQQSPRGGSKGSTLDHVGFQVPDLQVLLEKLRKGGYRIVTDIEVPAALSSHVHDGVVRVPDQTGSTALVAAFVMGPDGIKIELMENVALTTPLAIHHFHLFTPRVDETKAWYVETFGGTPGTRGPFETADFQGINLTFSAAGGQISSTSGRVLDHIGFEVKDLDAVCAELDRSGIAIEGPYETDGFTVVSLKDPWGTSIELTEGLDLF